MELIELLKHAEHKRGNQNDLTDLFVRHLFWPTKPDEPTKSERKSFIQKAVETQSLYVENYR